MRAKYLGWVESDDLALMALSETAGGGALFDEAHADDCESDEEVGAAPMPKGDGDGDIADPADPLKPVRLVEEMVAYEEAALEQVHDPAKTPTEELELISLPSGAVVSSSFDKVLDQISNSRKLFEATPVMGRFHG